MVDVLSIMLRWFWEFLRLQPYRLLWSISTAVMTSEYRMVTSVSHICQNWIKYISDCLVCKIKTLLSINTHNMKYRTALSLEIWKHQFFLIFNVFHNNDMSINFLSYNIMVSFFPPFFPSNQKFENLTWILFFFCIVLEDWSLELFLKKQTMESIKDYYNLTYLTFLLM